jgi:hypothetical protein
MLKMSAPCFFPAPGITRLPSPDNQVPGFPARASAAPFRHIRQMSYSVHVVLEFVSCRELDGLCREDRCRLIRAPNLQENGK